MKEETRPRDEESYIIIFLQTACFESVIFFFFHFHWKLTEMAVILGSNVSELRTLLCFLLVFTVVVTAILSMDAMLDLTNSKGFASKVRHVVESKELETREIIVQEEACGSSKDCHQNRTEIEHLIQQEQLTMLETGLVFFLFVCRL